MLFYTMKQKLSITIDRKLIEKIEKFVDEGIFRNKSHAIEYSVNKFIGGKNE